MGLTIDTAPVAEPVTTAEAKAWANISTSTDDVAVDFMIKAAREYVELFSGRALMQQTWNLTLDKFPKEINPPKPPLQSVASIKYTHTDGTADTLLASTEYKTDIKTEPGRIREAFDKSWPATRSEMNAVTVKFVAGYADAASVPEALKSAIKMIVAHWYNNREATLVGLKIDDMPYGVKALVRQERIPHF